MRAAASATSCLPMQSYLDFEKPVAQLDRRIAELRSAAEGDEVTGPHARVGRERALLRDVPDAGVAAVHGLAGHADAAAGQGLESQDAAEERRLPGSRRTEDRDELAGPHREVESRPELAVSPLQGTVGDLEDRTGLPRGSLSL